MVFTRKDGDFSRGELLVSGSCTPMVLEERCRGFRFGWSPESWKKSQGRVVIPEKFTSWCLDNGTFKGLKGATPRVPRVMMLNLVWYFAIGSFPFPSIVESEFFRLLSKQDPLLLKHRRILVTQLGIIIPWYSPSPREDPQGQHALAAPHWYSAVYSDFDGKFLDDQNGCLVSQHVDVSIDYSGVWE